MLPRSRRFLMLGFRAVGKSSLCIQYVNGKFSDDYTPTITETYSKSAEYKGKDYSITIMDTEGQDEFSLFSPIHSIQTHGYILVYSVTSRKSFEVIEVIFEKMDNMTGGMRVPMLLVGNKKDLQAERAVSVKEGRELASKWKCAFIETSAKNNLSANDLFNCTLNEVDKLMDLGLKSNNQCVIS